MKIRKKKVGKGCLVSENWADFGVFVCCACFCFVGLGVFFNHVKIQQTGCSSIFAKYQGQLEYVEGELISSGRKLFCFLFRYTK